MEKRGKVVGIKSSDWCGVASGIVDIKVGDKKTQNLMTY